MAIYMIYMGMGFKSHKLHMFGNLGFDIIPYFVICMLSFKTFT